MATHLPSLAKPNTACDDEFVAKRLVRALETIMRDVLGDQQSQMLLPKRNHVIQAFRFDRQHEALGT